MKNDKLNRPNEQLLAPIEMLVKDGLAQNASPGELAQSIIEAMASRVTPGTTAFYARENDISLLTVSARVLITLILEPGITRRAISIYLGATETAITTALNSLLAYGLIAKTKVSSRNIYKIDEKAFLNQGDIRHIWAAINKLSKESGEEEPF